MKKIFFELKEVVKTEKINLKNMEKQNKLEENLESPWGRQIQKFRTLSQIDEIKY